MPKNSVRRVPALTGLSTPALQSIDEAVWDFMKRWQIPGGSVAITKNGRLVYARGFGMANLPTQTPVSPQHRFRIASLSKPITSVAIMQLVQEGRLRLDAPVFGSQGILNDSTTYGAIADERIKQITVRHLLQHTGGWDRELSGDPMCGELPIAQEMGLSTPAEPVTIIQYMLRRPLDFTPGNRFAYSNLGYNILGRVIEKVAGTTYENYVKSAIFYPLGIEDVQLAKNEPAPQASGEVSYYETSNGLPRRVNRNGGLNLEAMDAHGGWVATASDLLRLLTAMDGSDTRPDLLTPASLKTMTKPAPFVRSNYALGWWVNNQGDWCHTGSLPGTSALMERTNDGYTWAVLFNQRSGDDRYFDELYQLMWDATKTVKYWPTHDLFQLPVAMNLHSDPTSVALLPTQPGAYRVTKERLPDSGGFPLPGPHQQAELYAWADVPTSRRREASVQEEDKIQT